MCYLKRLLLKYALQRKCQIVSTTTTPEFHSDQRWVPCFFTVISTAYINCNATQIMTLSKSDATVKNAFAMVDALHDLSNLAFKHLNASTAISFILSSQIFSNTNIFLSLFLHMLVLLKSSHKNTCLASLITAKIPCKPSFFNLLDCWTAACG